MIADDTIWLEILKARNTLAHTYSDEEALAVIRKLKEKYIYVFLDLKQELDTKWLAF